MNKTRPYTKRQRHPDRHAKFYPLSVDSPEAKLRSRKASSREPWGYSGLSTRSSHVASRRLRPQKPCSHFVDWLGVNGKPTGRVTPGMKWLYQCIVRTCTITQVGRAKQGKARRGGSNQANEKVSFTLYRIRLLHRSKEARDKGKFTSWHGNGSNFTASVGSTVQNSHPPYQAVAGFPRIFQDCRQQ